MAFLLAAYLAQRLREWQVLVQKNGKLIWKIKNNFFQKD
jgi:hypothetical protein